MTKIQNFFYKYLGQIGNNKIIFVRSFCILICYFSYFNLPAIARASHSNSKNLTSKNLATQNVYIEDAPARIASLEKKINGENESTKNYSLIKRISSLELVCFGKLRKASLIERIVQLEKFAGVTYQTKKDTKINFQEAIAKKIVPTYSKFMPPIPPQYDNGVDKQTFPPVVAASSLKNDFTKELKDAVSLHQSGKILEAEESLRNILSKSPNNSDAFFSLGAIAESRGDFNRALDYYKKAYESNSNDIESKNAIEDITRKMRNNNEVFKNPFNTSYETGSNSSNVFSSDNADSGISPSNKILQGRALEQEQLNVGKRELSGRTSSYTSVTGLRSISSNSGSSNAIITNSALNLGASKKNTIARTLARAALSTALRSAGIHCPACQILNRF